VHLRDRRETLESPGDVRAMLAKEDALTVRRVRANAHICRDAELWHSFFHGADRTRHDVVRFARKEAVLVLAVADAEKQQASDPRRRGGTRLAHHLGERQALEPRRCLDLFAIFDRAADDDRKNDSTGEVRARKRSRPHRVLCEPPSRERDLSHGAMLRTIAGRAVAKGYHFVAMRRRPAALLTLGVGLVLAASGAAFAATPSLTARTETVAAPAADESTAISAPVTLAAPAAPEPVAIPAPEPAAAPASMVFDDMKHVWQSLNNCGPASVVMALSTFGIDVSQEFARVPLRGTNILSGMGPQKVDSWVNANFGLRSVWRNNGTNDLLRRLVANGFAPMVTQWMQDPSISRIAHWRVVRGYDDAASTFYVNDPMLGNMVPLSYSWFQKNWQSFSYRYMVIYDPKDEALLKAVIGDDWNDAKMRKNFYERTKADASAQDTSAAWLAYGEAAYGYGLFREAVTAFERGMALGSVQGVFTLRSSYPQALRALGRQGDADAMQQRLSTSASSSTVASPPDPYALYLAFMRDHENDPAQLVP
jgi:peptidase C39-like protein